MSEKQTTPSGDYERMLEKLRKPTAPWVPQKDAGQPREIIGEVVDRYETTSAFDAGVVVPVISLETEDEEWVVAAYAGGLRGKLERLDPQIGDVLGIAYLGRAGDDEKSPHRYTARRFSRGEGERPGTAETRPRFESDDADPAFEPPSSDDDIPF